MKTRAGFIYALLVGIPAAVMAWDDFGPISHAGGAAVFPVSGSPSGSASMSADGVVTISNEAATRSIDIGTGTSTGSGRFGGLSTATNFYALALGYSADAKGQLSTSVGYNALVEGDNSSAIGDGSSVTADQAVAIGSNATISTTGYRSIAIGRSAAASHSASAAIGAEAVTFAANQIVLGSLTYPSSIALRINAATPTTHAGYGSIWLDAGGDLNFKDHAGVAEKITNYTRPKAGIEVAENVTATTIAVLDTWYQVTAGMVAGDLTSWTYSAGTLTAGAGADGYYFASCSFGMTGTTGHTLRFALSLNDVILTPSMPRKLGSTDVGLGAYVAGLQIVATDEVKFKIKNVGASADATITDLDCILMRI